MKPGAVQYVRLSQDNYDRRLRELVRMRRSGYIALFLGATLLVLALMTVHHTIKWLSAAYGNAFAISGIFLLVLFVSIYGGVSIAIRWFLEHYERARDSDFVTIDASPVRSGGATGVGKIMLRLQQFVALAAMLGGGVLSQSRGLAFIGYFVFFAGLLSLIARFALRKRLGG